MTYELSALDYRILDVPEWYPISIKHRWFWNMQLTSEPVVICDKKKRTHYSDEKKPKQIMPYSIGHFRTSRRNWIFHQKRKKLIWKLKPFRSWNLKALKLGNLWEFLKPDKKQQQTNRKQNWPAILETEAFLSRYSAACTYYFIAKTQILWYFLLYQQRTIITRKQRIFVASTNLQSKSEF